MLRFLGSEGFTVSDRRIMQLLRLLKCFAYVQGDSHVCVEHLHQLLPFCLWTKESSEIPTIKKAIDAACPNPKKHLKSLLKTAEEETKEAVRQTGEQPDGVLERATQQIVNIEKEVSRTRDSGVSNLPAADYKKILSQLRDLREELAEAKELAVY